MPDGGGDIGGHAAEACEVVVAVVVGVAEFGLADLEVRERMPCVEHADFCVPAGAEVDVLESGALETPFAGEGVAELAEIVEPGDGLGGGFGEGEAERLEEETEETPVEGSGVAGVPALGACEAGVRVEDRPCEPGEEFGGGAGDVGVVGGDGERVGVGESGAGAEPEIAAFAVREGGGFRREGWGDRVIVPEDLDRAGEIVEERSGEEVVVVGGGVESDDDVVEPCGGGEGLADGAEGWGSEFAGVGGEDEGERAETGPRGEVALEGIACGGGEPREGGDGGELEEIGHWAEGGDGCRGVRLQGEGRQIPAGGGGRDGLGKGMGRALIIVHYHYRPGGVRQVVEWGAAAVARCWGCDRVVMLGGERVPEGWRGEFERAVFPIPVRWESDAGLGYWSEFAGEGGAEELLRREVGSGDVVWAHNLSVGRRLRLGAMVVRVAEAAGASVWLHQHDWWWDGRWERWVEFGEQGVESLEEAVALTFPAGERVRTVAVNAADARFARDVLGRACGFGGNPLVRVEPGRAAVEEALEWLRGMSGGRPVWVYPARALRRKNFAEAVLVMRAVDDGAMLVTTGGVSSGAERGWYAGMERAVEEGGWPVRLAVAELDGAPTVPAMMGAAEAVVMSSLREGFGLPWWEAAVLRRPLLARRLAGTRETLEAVGLGASAAWDAVMVSRETFDAGAEEERVGERRERVLGMLPGELRGVVRGCAEESGGLVDFGALSFEAQREVVDCGVGLEERWNSWLGKVRGGMRVPAEVDEVRAGPEAWAARFCGMGPDGGGLRGGCGGERLGAALGVVVREWLRHPLLWP